MSEQQTLSPHKKNPQSFDVKEVIDGEYHASANVTSLNEEKLSKIPDTLLNLLGKKYASSIRTVPDLLAVLGNVMEARGPWDPKNIDEETVQMMLHVFAETYETYQSDFFERIAIEIDGSNWIYNKKAGYGKTYIKDMPGCNIKAGLYRWDEGCIAPLHDHGSECVAFYCALGSKSRLLNKVYNKLNAADEEVNSKTIKVEKEYDEILDGRHSRIGILQPHHAHAIQNLSDGASFTLHVYVPQYEFGNTWDYENRLSVMAIRRSMLVKFSNEEENSLRRNSSRRSIIPTDDRVIMLTPRRSFYFEG